MAPTASGHSRAVPYVTSGHGDAHWDPSTQDLAAELPALLTRLAGEGFLAYRVMFNPADWPETPRTVAESGRTVKLGAFHTQRRHTITMVDGSGRSRVDVHDDSPVST